MASIIPPPHVPFALGTSSLLDILRPGALIPFPLPSPPSSTAIFPPLRSSYLPDNIAPAAFSLFFLFVFGFPYLGLMAFGDSLSSACCRFVTRPHRIKHLSPPPAAMFRLDRVRASLCFCRSSPC